MEKKILIILKIDLQIQEMQLQDLFVKKIQMKQKKFLLDLLLIPMALIAKPILKNNQNF